MPEPGRFGAPEPAGVLGVVLEVEERGSVGVETPLGTVRGAGPLGQAGVDPVVAAAGRLRGTAGVRVDLAYPDAAGLVGEDDEGAVLQDIGIEVRDLRRAQALVVGRPRHRCASRGHLGPCRDGPLARGLPSQFLGSDRAVAVCIQALAEKRFRAHLLAGDAAAAVLVVLAHQDTGEYCWAPPGRRAGLVSAGGLAEARRPCREITAPWPFS